MTRIANPPVRDPGSQTIEQRRAAYVHNGLRHLVASETVQSPRNNVGSTHAGNRQPPAAPPSTLGADTRPHEAGAVSAVVGDELRAAARGLGPMILSNGLGQTVVFYASRTGKNKRAYQAVSDLLAGWLFEPGLDFPRVTAGTTDSLNLLDAITKHDADTYFAAQAESLVFSKWLAMLAGALIPKGRGSIDDATRRTN